MKKGLPDVRKPLSLFVGVPKGMDRYVPNIEDIILFAKIKKVNIRKNICKDNMLGKVLLDGIG